MWIVKVGGSLATAEVLPVWLEVLSCYGGGEVVVVPGGGPFAELVYESQAYWKFDDSSAHFMALLAMTQFGLMLSSMQPDLVPVERKEDIERVLGHGGVPVWLPTEMVTDDDSIAHSWDVTSDSLAAWLARHLGASRLLLVKSVEVDKTAPIVDLARQGVVDACFPDYARQGDFSVNVMSQKEFDQIPQMLMRDTSGPVRVNPSNGTRCKRMP
ncbi:MAG TPA: aspartate kinase [Gammaproteobacteria bacterium]|nr:aspartate kinase [Gammaproteobacteria bacterium]